MPKSDKPSRRRHRRRVRGRRTPGRWAAAIRILQERLQRAQQADGLLRTSSHMGVSVLP